MNYGTFYRYGKVRNITSAKEVADILNNCECWKDGFSEVLVDELNPPSVLFRDAGVGLYTITKFPKTIVKLLNKEKSNG